MPEAITLPIPAAHREFTVKVNGEALPREHHLVSASIRNVANRIAAARLVYLDGAAATGRFDLSDSPKLVPGARVEVLAGSNQDAQPLFSGIVVRHSIRVRERGASQLIVDCRHPAVRMTAPPRNAVFVDSADSDVIERLLGDAGITADVESTPETHTQLVQVNCTDWEFMLQRAERAGMWVLADGDGLAVRKPALEGEPAATLEFGATLLEFDAEVDARLQLSGATGEWWDPSQQSMVEAPADEPSFATAGNLDPGELADVVGSDVLEVRHAANSEGEARMLAQSEWDRARINKLTGRAKCEGIATLRPGGVVTLRGVGERFSGQALISGVRHEFDLVNGWKTHVQFGGVAPSRAAPVVQSGPTPAHGLMVGVVLTNEDPESEYRVQVKLPMVSAGEDGLWARVASVDAGADRGLFVRPEVGDEVIVGFVAGDPRSPVILGMLHSSANAAPIQGSDSNPQKVYASREGVRVAIDDEAKSVLVETPGGNSILISDQDQKITITDQSGNSVEMSSEGIAISSASALELKAATELKIEAGTSLSVKGGTDLKLEGSTQAELSSSGVTKVAGTSLQVG